MTELRAVIKAPPLPDDLSGYPVCQATAYGVYRSSGKHYVVCGRVLDHDGDHWDEYDQVPWQFADATESEDVDTLTVKVPVPALHLNQELRNEIEHDAAEAVWQVISRVLDREMAKA